MEKKRVIKSLGNLDQELKAKLRKQYPDGFEGNLVRLTNAKNEPFFCVPLDTEDTTYLVKIAVSKNSEGEYDIDLDEDDLSGDGPNLSTEGYDDDFDDD